MYFRLDSLSRITILHFTYFMASCFILRIMILILEVFVSYFVCFSKLRLTR